MGDKHGREMKMGKGINAPDIHRLVVCSDLRRNILLSLNEGHKSLGDLRDDLKISSTTAIHALKDLEKSDITFQDKNRNYSLTNIGKIVALKLLDFSEAAEVLKNHNRFWLDHDLSGIPQQLMEKIGYLKNSNLSVLDVLNFNKMNDYYLYHIEKAKWVECITPIYSTDYSKVYQELAAKNIPLKLIFSQPVFNKLIEEMGQNNYNFSFNKNQVDTFVTDENPKMAFTITDTFFSFGLFNNNGIFDVAHHLISTDDMAIRWGHELFKYYKEKSKKMF